MSSCLLRWVRALEGVLDDVAQEKPPCLMRRKPSSASSVAFLNAYPELDYDVFVELDLGNVMKKRAVKDAKPP